MDKSFDGLRQKVLAAVQEQKTPPKNPDQHRQQVLIEFIRLRLAELDISENRFAQLINQPVDQVQGLFENSLTTPDEEMLQRIASVLAYDVHLFRIILTGSPVSDSSNNPSGSASHST